jgi:hypothetical protein
MRAGGNWDVTGNHYLAIPLLSLDDAGIYRLNVLHRGAVGLLEWASNRTAGDREGGALLAPELRDGDRPLELGPLTWERLDRWIPRFRAEPEPGLSVQGTLCAPGGGPLLVAGAVYTFEIENRTGRDRTLDVGLGGTWRWSLRTIESSRPLTTPNRISHADGEDGLVLELGGEPGLTALGIMTTGTGVRIEAAANDSPLTPLGAGDTITAQNGTPIRLRIGRSVTVANGRRVMVSFYLGVAVERDGALAQAATLRGYGAAADCTWHK